MALNLTTAFIKSYQTEKLPKHRQNGLRMTVLIFMLQESLMCMGQHSARILFEINTESKHKNTFPMPPDPGT